MVTFEAYYLSRLKLIIPQPLLSTYRKASNIAYAMVTTEIRVISTYFSI
jgi:hypothetical protein